MHRRLFVGMVGAYLIAPFRALGSPLSASSSASAEEIVSLNTKSLKYHCRTCRAIRTCTHCVDMPISKAREKGVACKICGGSCG